MYLRTKKILILFFSNLLFYSCIQDKNRLDASATNNIDNDSLIHFIESSQSSSLEHDEKKSILVNALKLTNNLPHDSLKIKYLSNLSYKSINTSDSLFFRKVNNQTIRIAIKLEDSAALAEAKWDLGIFLNNTHLKDSTYFYYNEALNIYSKLDNKSKVGYLLYNIAIVQTAIGDFSGAELSAIKALEILKSINDIKGLYSCYNIMGNISNSIGEYSRAIEFYEKANTFLDSIKNTDNDRISIINNIGVSNNFLGNFKKAEENFQKAVDFDSLKIKNPVFYAKALTNLANAKISLKTKEDLEPLFTEAIEIQKNEDNLFGEATSTDYYAKYLAFKGDSTAAINFGEYALTLAQESSNTESLLRTLDFLTLIDKKNASSYAQEYFAVNDKLQKDERTLRDKFARVRFQTDEFIEKNDILANQNELLTRQKQLWTGISVAGLLAVLAVLVIIWQGIKNRNLKFKQQQQESNQEIFNLLMAQQGKLEEGKKIEQERISQELHDGVLNKMLGIRLVLIGLNKKTDQESIELRAELIKELADLSEEIRSVSHELSNAAYQKIQNFIESIKSLVETFRSATAGINYNFKYNHDFEWDAIDGDIKINLYRILQEGIQNCIKHAEASTIFINFDISDKEIIATIEDNGKGIDPKKLKKGIGFRNISSRLKKMEGDWDISSKLDVGTTMTIKIPHTDLKKKVA